MSRLIVFIPAIDPGPSIDGSFDGGIFLFLLAVNVLLNLPIDIFSSYGMYCIAKVNGVNHPWIAWIPLANLWILGSIADTYRKGCLRWILVGHQILTVLLWLAVFRSTEFVLLAKLLSEGLLLIVVWTIVGIGVLYLALHRLYSMCLISNAELFTVLSIIFSLPTPFFIMHCANLECDN